jgi:preprotein translocase subunit SecD
MGATLTLPGIAGIALTIGIAVDANVLIYERIREELRLGKTPRSAVDTGYQRATITIMDANVTSLIAALVLYQFGTGPVKGFAVTLSIGLVANLFTAIFVTRIIFDYLLTERRVKELSI